MSGKLSTQFKYSFMAGLNIRGQVFAVIFIMNTVFIILGSLGLLPFPAQVTAVSLAGTAIAVMLAVNIIGDIAIGRQMLGSQRAYLTALTPVPRWKTLLAGIISMGIMDIVSMTLSIISVVWLSFNLAGLGSPIELAREGMRLTGIEIYTIFWSIMIFIAVYFLFITVIIFSEGARRSFLYNIRGGGFLSLLLAFGCFYLVSLLQIVFAPFGSVLRFGIFMSITMESTAAPALFLLIALSAAGFFLMSSKLIERRINL